MKRSLAARTPTLVAPLAPATSPTTETSPVAPAVSATTVGADKKWEFDGPQGVPAPVIRANMISFRVSYQGRVQVAFFDQE
jgi:hypothetical protein